MRAGRWLPALTRALRLVPLLLGLGGCAVTPLDGAINRPVLPAGTDAPPAFGNDLALRPVLRGDTLLMLSFSGGGMRAAAFAAGVLEGLREATLADGSALLSHVGFISSVSGGSLTAAWYRLHGVAGLDRIRSDLLLRDGEAGLRLSLLNPANLLRLATGGLNDRSTLYPWLDGEIFAGATYRDLLSRDGPVVWINATNLASGIAFPFHERSFDALCSDLASLPVAEAVAASMAVPLLFTPIRLRSHPAHCPGPLPDWADAYRLAFGDRLLRRRLLQTLQAYRRPEGSTLTLVDGALSDNIGLTSLVQSRWLIDTPQAPLSLDDALRVRRLLFLVVDAGQQPSADADAPAWRDGSGLALAALNATIDANARLSLDAFVPFMAEWREAVAGLRCALDAPAQQALRAQQPGWRCDDVSFELARLSFEDLPAAEASELGRIPTSLKLQASQVEHLMRAGRQALHQQAPVRRLLASPGSRSSPR